MDLCNFYECTGLEFPILSNRNLAGFLIKKNCISKKRGRQFIIIMPLLQIQRFRLGLQNGELCQGHNSHLIVILTRDHVIFKVCCSEQFFGKELPNLRPDHVQVFWKHKSMRNQASDWLTRQVNRVAQKAKVDLKFCTFLQYPKREY